MQQPHQADPAESPGPGKAALIVLGVIIGVAIYIAIASVALGLHAIYGGFFFVLFWTGFNHADPAAFMPGLLGALAGIGLGAALILFPFYFGTAGTVAALALVLLAIWLLIMGRLTMIVNLSTMLFLTVVTIPEIARPAVFLEIAAAVVLMAVLLKATFLLFKLVSNRRSAKPVGSE